MRSTSTSIRLADFAEAPRAFRALRGRSWGLAVCAVSLSLVGVATVSSAAAELPLSYGPRQVVWLLLGVVVAVLAAVIDYKVLLRVTPLVYGGAVLALAWILVFGEEAGGARSWVGIGTLGGQPTDLAKLAVVLALVRLFAGLRAKYIDGPMLIAAALLAGVPIALVGLQPDYGSALMFLPMVALLVLMAGLRVRTLVIGGVLSLVLGASVWTLAMQDYQRDRVLTFVNPDRDPLGAGYQARQSKIAVGSGGLVGKGYRQGTQSQLHFLPARHTDFVFAVLAEEWGFLGVLGTLALFVVFLWQGVRITLDARDRAGMLLGAGLLSVLAAHTLYNTGMVVGLLPVTGIPLPFLSYGGSFTLFCFGVTGVLLGIDLRRYVNA